MRLLIKPKVHWAIDSFYEAALLHYQHTLTLNSVLKKKKRLYDGLDSLKDFYKLFPNARLRKSIVVS